MKKTFLILPVLTALTMTAHAKSLTQSTLSLEQASVLASEAVKSCSAKGYNVSVTVVDAAGLTRAVQRMDNAGPHTLTASYQKAFTSASSGAATSQLLENSNKYPAAKNLGDILVSYYWLAAYRLKKITPPSVPLVLAARRVVILMKPVHSTLLKS